MEEKERFELFGEHCIKDNNPNARCQLLNAYVACVILNEQDKENQQLKQQLAEKDKEIVRLNKFLQAMKIREHNQDEISFAIEQLELARRRIDRLGYNENKCLNKKDCIEDCLEEIDNQIKAIKGEK